MIQYREGSVQVWIIIGYPNSKIRSGTCRMCSGSDHNRIYYFECLVKYGSDNSSQVNRVYCFECIVGYESDNSSRVNFMRSTMKAASLDKMFLETRWGQFYNRAEHLGSIPQHFVLILDNCDKKETV